MPSTNTSDQENRSTPLILQALSYPFRRLGWLIVIVACATVLLGLLSLGVVSGRILFVALLSVGVVVRCYFSTVENALTGWGEEAWQGQGFRMEGLWGSLGAVTGAALISWSPTLLVAWTFRDDPGIQEITVNGAAALGCEYFCMAVLALVVFQNFSQTLPHRVLPAIFRCGASYMFAGLGLMLVPWSFWVVLEAIEPQVGFPRWINASAIGAFFLTAHARLIGLIYVANRERIGWE